MKSYLSALLLGGVLAVSALEVPELSLPFMEKEPVADGVIAADEWRHAAAMDGSCFNAKSPGVLFPAEMRFYVGATREKLWIAVRSEYGPAGLRQRMMPGENNVDTFSDDSIETVIIPDLDAAKPLIVHCNINNRGAVYRMAKANGAVVPFSGKWTAKGKAAGGIWEFEASIPWRDLGITPGKLPVRTGLRLCRNWKNYAGGWAQTAWEPVKTEFFSAASIPVVNWRVDTPVIQVADIRKYASGVVAPGTMSIYNPSRTALPLKISYRFFPLNSQDFRMERSLSVPPGETERLSLPGGPAAAAELVNWMLNVTSPDGRKVYYRRELALIPAKPQEIFLAGRSGEARIGFSFAHYPSYRKILFRADFANVAAPGKIKRVSAVISAAGREVAVVPLPLPAGNGKNSLLEWDTPDFAAFIPAGKTFQEFQVDFMVDGKKASAQKFEYHRFDWLGNRIGKSDCIVPPFTGVRIKNDTVDVLLRRYKLNSLGLPAQIFADGEPLLQDGGMRLEATIGGRIFRAEGALQLTHEGKGFAATRSAWRAGALNGESDMNFDQDGAMQWRLTLKPGVKIDAMQLIVPLVDAQMPLMHSVGDGARINYAGYVPAGKGKIWDASKVVRIGLSDFVPYLWLGGESRGLAVFGENDKGWAPGKGVAEFELRRENGILLLVLNLIGKPIDLQTARTISLGFMASPVKPMPENWRRWNAWSHEARQVSGKDFSWQFNFLGSGWYYGTVTPCADLWPRDKDMRVLEKMGAARKTGVRPTEWLLKWAEQGPRDQYFEERKKHILNGFNRAMATGDAVVFYYNARGARYRSTAEGRHFLNEWYRYAAADREVMDAMDYELDPAESYRDCALYWYRRTLETGAMDQMYWDDVFPAPNFNVIGSDAYFRADGSIQPASGIRNMRELVRRSAVMMTEMKRMPRFMLHMTSTNVLPILSYGAMNFDWEQNCGGADFQTRNSREYIRAMSIGRQAGNFPVMLVADSAPQEKKAYDHWIRTASGVMLTHELRWHKNFPEFWRTLKRLFDFGYGLPGVEVRNYWEKDYPVTFGGRQTSSLLTLRSGKAQLLVCDWDGGGDYAVNVDATRMKLKKNAAAYDAESGRKLQFDGKTVRFSLKKHDFKIIEFH